MNQSKERHNRIERRRWELKVRDIGAEEGASGHQLSCTIMMAHPVALQLRNLQSLVEIGVDKNTTVVFPAPIMSTIEELGSFIAREKAARDVAQPTPDARVTRARGAGRGRHMSSEGGSAHESVGS
jgi:hypothetical protein